MTTHRRPAVRRPGRALVVGLVALVLTGACTDEPDGAPTTAPPASVGSPTSSAGTSVVSTSIPEPASLLPLDATDPGGLAVVRALNTGLVTYDPETSEAVPAVAESIRTTDDGTTWRIRLEEGWTFHDGTAVTAHSFVDAWNHGAHGPNARAHRTAFAAIEGFAALQCGTRGASEQEGNADEPTEPVPNCDAAPPETDQLAGLEVVSETEFTVTLTEPSTSWPQRLGYPAYAALPPVFFDDPAGFAVQPVGNGPFRLVDAGRPDDTISTVAYEGYAGEPGPQVAGVDFRIQPDRDDALTALHEGQIDVMTDIPPERWPETQSRVAHTEALPSAALDYLGFPVDDDAYADPDLRAALSMAVDRALITETLFDGLRTPATDVLPPVVPGHDGAACPTWRFDPETARERLDEAGRVDGPITVWFNEDGGHRAWLEAVARQWSTHLGIDESEIRFEGRPFEEYVDLVATGSVTGPFRMGWEMRYPHPRTYLQPLLDSGSRGRNGTNSTGYASDAFDQALDRARAVTGLDEAVSAYREAISIACEDVPIAPMFYGTRTVAWNDTLDDVRIGPLGLLDYTALTAASGT